MNIYQNSHSQTAMVSVWSVSKLSTESVGSRRELVANCVHTADADATNQFRRVGVGGVYWALCVCIYCASLFRRWEEVGDTLVLLKGSGAFL